MPKHSQLSLYMSSPDGNVHDSDSKIGCRRLSRPNLKPIKKLSTCDWSLTPSGQLDPEKVRPPRNSCTKKMKIIRIWRLPHVPVLPDPCHTTANYANTCHLQSGVSMLRQCCKLRCNVAAIQKQAPDPFNCSWDSTWPNLTPTKKCYLHNHQDFLTSCQTVKVCFDLDLES